MPRGRSDQDVGRGVGGAGGTVHAGPADRLHVRRGCIPRALAVPHHVPERRAVDAPTEGRTREHERVLGAEVDGLRRIPEALGLRRHARASARAARAERQQGISRQSRRHRGGRGFRRPRRGRLRRRRGPADGPDARGRRHADPAGAEQHEAGVRVVDAPVEGHAAERERGAADQVHGRRRELEALVLGGDAGEGERRAEHARAQHQVVAPGRGRARPRGPGRRGPGPSLGLRRGRGRGPGLGLGRGVGPRLGPRGGRGLRRRRGDAPAHLPEVRGGLGAGPVAVGVEQHHVGLGVVDAAVEGHARDRVGALAAGEDGGHRHPEALLLVDDLGE
eukprot:CAMPEP_0179352352 /NCGR_PEP_ID=MMETSP0797-20121207/75760_1 /TAXON_ID=47934 /ORGANISM="Dinophysis acuminata, Strain DAEP01" /LENGTH=333 /DNA_ID=CAMNT_0021067359 /DNA_START=494 /DNA_END=1492 /DNA_ORIENTATION=+